MRKRAIRRRSELVDAGVTRAGLREAVERGQVVPVAHGVLATPEAARHPRLDDAVACLVTDGVICGRSAAMRHGLSDDMPDLVEMLVPPVRSRPPQTLPLALRRSQDRRVFTVGVGTEDVCGVKVRMTGRARTVVDHYRFGEPEHHTLQALQTFLGEGGTGDELASVDAALGAGVWKTMQRDVAGFGLAVDRRHAREPDRQDEPGHDDGARRPGL